MNGFIVREKSGVALYSALANICLSKLKLFPISIDCSQSLFYFLLRLGLLLCEQNLGGIRCSNLQNLIIIFFSVDGIGQSTIF